MPLCAFVCPRTTDDDLDSVPATATHVLVAARDGLDCDEFALAAWGERTAVLQSTHDALSFQGGKTKAPTLHRGVYWYRWPSHSFGFTSCPDLFLWYADALAAFGGCEEASGDRLSWNLEMESTGGFRAGKVRTAPLGLLQPLFPFSEVLRLSNAFVPTFVCTLRPFTSALETPRLPSRWLPFTPFAFLLSCARHPPPPNPRCCPPPMRMWMSQCLVPATIMVPGLHRPASTGPLPRSVQHPH